LKELQFHVNGPNVYEITGWRRRSGAA